MDANWYAVFEDDSYHKYEEPNLGINCSYWVKEIDTGIEHVTSSGNVWANYRYEFYDSTLNLIHLNFNEWKVLQISDVAHKTIFTDLILEIRDPKGRIKGNFKVGSSILGVIKVIKLLRELSSFESWQNYELYSQIKETQKKMKVVSEKMANLKDSIKELRNLPFLNQIINELNKIDSKDYLASKNQLNNISSKYNIDISILKLWLLN